MLEHNHYGDSTWANWISSSKWAVYFSPYLTFTHYLKALQHLFQISKTRLTNQVEGKKLQKIRVLKGIRWLINPVLQQVQKKRGVMGWLHLQPTQADGLCLRSLYMQPSHHAWIVHFCNLFGSVCFKNYQGCMPQFFAWNGGVPSRIKRSLSLNLRRGRRSFHFWRQWHFKSSRYPFLQRRSFALF